MSGAGDDRPDRLLTDIADYVLGPPAPAEALAAAALCLTDALACALLAVDHPEARRHVAPVVRRALLAGGARVPGTLLELDPVRAAHATGCLIRWLDYNDTWLAEEWGHPSDNLGALLALADYLDRNERPVELGELLDLMVKAYEIQGVLAMGQAFNRLGLDHVILVRVASTACATRLLGGDREAIIAALSNAWLDGAALRTYRHAPNTGWRKSWAAGDATARAVQHALNAVQGEMGYPQALSAPRWGFEAVVMGGESLHLPQPLASYVIENILFKIAFPVEFHAQTAVECALALHPWLAGREAQIEAIEIGTQEAGDRIINKSGPLHNPADRDHCLQYAVAFALLHGRLDASSFDDAAAADERIDRLRERMVVVEEPAFTTAYHDPQRRAIPNRVDVRLTNGEQESRTVEYPVGHPRRRAEGLPLLEAKFSAAASRVLPQPHGADLLALLSSAADTPGTRVGQLLELLQPGA